VNGSADKPLALMLMGPTASGKSALAVELARLLGGEIISVDSSLVYRGMDIGTAKPSAELRSTIPHHLVDLLDPRETYSAGRFRRDALALVESISREGRIPILVGGTMLYFNTLLRGLAVLPRADSEVRARIDAEAAREGWPALHARLSKIDPEAARRIHPNDGQRIQRALEVYRLTGKPLSHWWAQDGEEGGELPFRTVKIAVAPESREILHRRIAARFRAMLQQGLIEEVRRLWRREDLHLGLPALRSVGYRQVWLYLDGRYDFSAMNEKAVIATRQLAKRQFTWLRRERKIHWFDSDDRDLAAKVISIVEMVR